MPVYTTNIPQATDNPSVSQGQLLQNFQTLNSTYGTSGDHYAWDDTNATEQAKHAKVTLPGLPTANPPGNALPTPLAGNCAIFGQTINSQTTPYVVRDGLAPTAPYGNIWPLLPIKAFATFLANPTGATVSLVSNFNVTSVTISGNFVTVNFTNAMRTTTYGVLAFGNNGGLNINVTSYKSTATTSVQIGVIGVGATTVSMIVVEP